MTKGTHITEFVVKMYQKHLMLLRGYHYDWKTKEK